MHVILLHFLDGAEPDPQPCALHPAPPQAFEGFWSVAFASIMGGGIFMKLIRPDPRVKFSKNMVHPPLPATLYPLPATRSLYALPRPFHRTYTRTLSFTQWHPSVFLATFRGRHWG